MVVGNRTEVDDEAEDKDEVENEDEDVNFGRAPQRRRSGTAKTAVGHRTEDDDEDKDGEEYGNDDVDGEMAGHRTDGGWAPHRWLLCAVGDDAGF